MHVGTGSSNYRTKKSSEDGCLFYGAAAGLLSESVTLIAREPWNAEHFGPHLVRHHPYKHRNPENFEILSKFDGPCNKKEIRAFHDTAFKTKLS